MSVVTNWLKFGLMENCIGVILNSEHESLLHIQIQLKLITELELGLRSGTSKHQYCHIICLPNWLLVNSGTLCLVYVGFAVAEECPSKLSHQIHSLPMENSPAFQE